MKNLLLQMELDVIHVSYKESRNPLLVWQALELCLDEKYPMPDWISDYLKEVASALLDLPKKRDELKKPSAEKSLPRAAFDVCKALGMSQPGSTDIFSNYLIYNRNQEIVSRVCGLIVRETSQGIEDHAKVTRAMETIAQEMKVEYSTVMDLYYKWVKKKILQEKTPFKKIWKRIISRQGKTFYTKSGKPFSYEIDKDYFMPSLTNYRISKSDFIKVYLDLPLEGPKAINRVVHGPSYIWAVLHDRRISKNEW
jgi:hypothetical protein